MELKLKIKYEELLNLIWQLPISELARLRSDLMHHRSPQENSHKSFQALLLSGPVMSDDQFAAFQANRNHFDQWNRD